MQHVAGEVGRRVQLNPGGSGRVTGGTGLCTAMIHQKRTVYQRRLQPCKDPTHKLYESGKEQIKATHTKLKDESSDQDLS